MPALRERVLHKTYPFDSNVFKVKTSNAGTSNADQFFLRCRTTGACLNIIDWGDGTSTLITAYQTTLGGTMTHTYPAQGEYTIQVRGDFASESALHQCVLGHDRLKYLEMLQWGFMQLGNQAFEGAANLEITANDRATIIATGNFGDGWRTFNGCSSIINIDVGQWRWESTIMRETFLSCTKMNGYGFEKVNLAAKPTESFLGLFSSCTAFKGSGIDTWNMSNVTTLIQIFNSGCQSLDVDLSGWNLSNNTSMQNWMWSVSSHDITRLNITNWDTSKVTNMQFLFRSCPLFKGDQTGADITGWDVSKVTTLVDAFFDDTVLQADLSGWDVGLCTNFSGTFGGSTVKANLNFAIENWNMSSAANISNMLQRCQAMNRNLSGWDVTSVTNATGFLIVTTISTANYDALLIGWEAQAVQDNVVAGFGSAKYTSGGAAEAARTALINDHNWTITDGGAA